MTGDDRTMLPLADLHEDAGNVREHDAKNLSTIRASLVEHGQVEPLVVQASTGRVIGGNGRLTVMRELGWTDAWVNLLDCSNVQATRLSLVLNRSAELARWKKPQLAAMLTALEADGEDVNALGWEEPDIETLMAHLQDVDNATPDDVREGGDASGKDDTSADVSFRFGQYSGLVSRPVYDAFVIAYRERQQATGDVMMDDVLRGWLDV